MLDDNLPTFFLKPHGKAKDSAHQQPVYFSFEGSEPSPTYTIQHGNTPNAYALGLFDSYNPDVLYGEVLAKPAWTHPTLNAEDIRANTPLQPTLPSSFDVQLYEPAQTVRINIKEGKWGGSDSYEFSVPETSFRVPSASVLDHSQSGPAELEITPRLNFVWRKESKLSRDLTCYMTGRSTDSLTAMKQKRSKRDPDIAVALWRQLRELTIYEPNLQRMELEDPKGFEVVLLLSAVVIKDLYMTSKDVRQTFNITSDSSRKLSSGGRKLSNPPPPTTAPKPPHLQRPPQPSHTFPPDIKHAPPTAPSRPSIPTTSSPTPLDPETATLRAQTEHEATQARQSRERAEEAETQRLRAMVEAEAREAERKNAELERETQRLRRQYGVQSLPTETRGGQMNSGRHRHHGGGGGSAGYGAAGGNYLQPIPQGRPSHPQQLSRPAARPSAAQSTPKLGSNGLYSQPSASASGLVMSGANGPGSGGSSGGEGRMGKKKKSFWGLSSSSSSSRGDVAREDEGGLGVDGSGRNRLAKKGSAMW